MKHTIDNKEVTIDWCKAELIDNHGSGCQEWVIKGEDENGNKYVACGNYQSDELIEVEEIEQVNI